jgi:F-box and leucine-rich repeat protein 1 (S-phase kinase-associated protein 2)
MNEILALIVDDSVIALANRCPHLRSLGLYFCKNITDNAMYSLAQSKVKNRMWGSVKGGNDEDGLRTLNISQCTALTPSAVQAVCDSSPALHTCSGRHSLIMSGCLNLTSVHCACAVHAHRAINTFPHSAHWSCFTWLQGSALEGLREVMLLSFAFPSLSIMV